VIPPVRTRDSVDISNEGYVIRVHGVEAGRGEAPAGMSLVLGEPPAGVPSQPTKDPVFGMDAAWVPAEFAVHAEVSGSTVIDRGSVITAHLAEVVRINASRIVSRQDVKLLVDTVKGSSPVVVDEMNASGLSLADVQGVLHSLLDEQVPVRDLVRILEAVSARARATKDLEALTEAARGALGPAISAAYASGDRLAVITVDAGLEHALVESLRAGEAGTFLAIDHENAERIAVSVAACARGAEEAGERPVLVTAAPLRPALRRLLRTITPNLPVLTVSEVGDHLQIETVGVVNLGQPATV
jgi:flagellar biosynthesis protein FlhA